MRRRFVLWREMMKLLTADEMREVDRKAQEVYGIPELVLMENAGHATAETAEKLLGGKLTGRHIVVVAGSGNNGGDAFSAARYFLNAGANVKVFFAGNRDHIKASPKIMLGILQKMDALIYPLDDDHDFDRFRVALRFADLVVDGVLGTGFTGALQEKMQRVIGCINGSNGKTLAIDMPSGIETDRGTVQTACVKADVTVTFGAPKIGQYLGGRLSCGEVILDTIGIPQALIERDEIRQTLIDEALAAALLPTRTHDAHKGTVGKFLVMAGSRGMTGAATLASESALRNGAGLVTLAIPESLNAIIEEKVTEVMTLPIKDEKRGLLSGHEASDQLAEVIDGYDALLIGPGLGRDEDTSTLIRGVAKRAKCPLILDADAIYAFRRHTKELKELAQVPILTPHLGEMAGLLSISIEELRADLVNLSRQAAKAYQGIFVVKSEETIVVYPDGNVFFTTKGNAGMATGGSGDVLAGTILGLMHEMESALAPILGVYLHGLAGDLAYGEYGEGLLASDIMHCLPKARMSLRAKNET